MNSLPKNLKINLTKYRDMRYGENPHQRSAFYIEDGVPGFEQLWGIELSHNNIGDANHAWKLVADFERPTVAIVKHANPSGITSRGSLEDAFNLAYGADSISAFGGIIAINREPTMDMIEAMRGKFFELMVAPKYSPEIVERLKVRSAKMRVVKAQKSPKLLEFTRAFNGYLVQTADYIDESFSKWKIASGDKPSKKLIADMEFAWKVVKHVKSNAIVIAKDENMVGMGTGQPNRVNSTMLALHQAFGKPPQDSNWSITKHSKTVGAVLASDAFFPFADNVELAAKAGITAIIQPGGSINDGAVIAAAKKHKIIMVFTGVRHFKH
jgi:phosphoribosylaminoimidazolecarboxamide formyltransferase/IMP cyclohydrolase